MTDTTTSSSTYALHPIEPDEADRLRAAGGPRHVADATPGYPCRQCLRDAEPGDELILVSHDPFATDSPYRSASPVFLHAESCGEPVARAAGTGAIPDQLAVRRLAVRGFDPAAMMLEATIVDGTDLAEALDALFADPRISVAHVHFAERGCWATNVTRSGAERRS